MTIFDQFEKLVEHKEYPNYSEFDLYQTRNMFSFISPAHAQIINQFVNFEHWDLASSPQLQLLFHQIIPKTNFNYKKLFGSYEGFAKSVDDKEELKIKYVQDCFDIGRIEAIRYLGIREFREKVEENLK